VIQNHKKPRLEERERESRERETDVFGNITLCIKEKRERKREKVLLIRDSPLCVPPKKRERESSA